MSETYTQEAKVITDLITGDKHNEGLKIEKTFHRIPLEVFDLLEDVHPTGKYNQVNGGTFYFNVIYYGIEFTFFCAVQFEGEYSR